MDIINIDIKNEAMDIIIDHAKGFMSCGDYNPDTTDDLWDTMLHECAFVLVKRFVDGMYTPMEFNAVRNELAKTINDLFRNHSN